MPDLLAELQNENRDLRAENEALRTRLAALQQDLELANRKLQHVLGRLFGRKTEQLDPRQLELLLSGSEAAPVVPAEPPAVPRPLPRGSRRASPRKPRIPENLPTENIVIEPEEVRATPQAYQCIGEEITQELDVVPPTYFRRLFIRRKYVSRADRAQPPIMGPLPPRLIPSGYASIGLVTDIVVKKYLDHLPLYRQEQMLRRYGIELSRQTMCDWLGHAAWWLKPIYQHIGHGLRQGAYLQIDETPVRFCQAEGGGSGQGYLWVYHRPGGDVLFEWHAGGGQRHFGICSRRNRSTVLLSMRITPLRFLATQQLKCSTPCTYCCTTV